MWNMASARQTGYFYIRSGAAVGYNMELRIGQNSWFPEIHNFRMIFKRTSSIGD